MTKHQPGASTNRSRKEQEGEVRLGESEVVRNLPHRSSAFEQKIHHRIATTYLLTKLIPNFIQIRRRQEVARAQLLHQLLVPLMIV